MLKVAITGGIGSGKSLASSIFKILGVPVYCSDLEAKSLMQNNSELIKLIKENYGTEAYNKNKLNTKYLSDLVFKDSSKLIKLNKLVHPFVMSDMNKWYSEKSNFGYKLFESAIIFENNLEHLFDYIIVVYAPKYIRIKRVKSRENISLDSIKNRMRNQLDDKIKIQKADFIIKNHNNLIVPQIIKIHNKLNTLSNHG